MTQSSECNISDDQGFETAQTVERKYHLSLVAAEIVVAEDYFNDLSGMWVDGSPDGQIPFGD